MHFLGGAIFDVPGQNRPLEGVMAERGGGKSTEKREMLHERID